MSHRARELPVGMRIWGYFLSSPQGTWEKMRGVLGKLEIDTRAVPSQTQKSKPFFRNLPRGHGGVGPEEGAGADPDLQVAAIATRAGEGAGRVYCQEMAVQAADKTSKYQCWLTWGATRCRE